MTFYNLFTNSNNYCCHLGVWGKPFRAKVEAGWETVQPRLREPGLVPKGVIAAGCSSAAPLRHKIAKSIIFMTN